MYFPLSVFNCLTEFMSESSNLPMNFGGIGESKYSALDAARVVVLPVSYEGTVSYGTGTGAGAMAIVDASRNMELYEEETDTEVYKIGIHTLDEFRSRPTPELMMDSLYLHAVEILKKEKFLCTLGGEHSISAPIIRAHAERYHNLSVLQIDAHADLRDTYDGTPHSHASIMARVVKRDRARNECEAKVTPPDGTCGHQAARRGCQAACSSSAWRSASALASCAAFFNQAS